MQDFKMQHLLVFLYFQWSMLNKFDLYMEEKLFVLYVCMLVCVCMCVAVVCPGTVCSRFSVVCCFLFESL